MCLSSEETLTLMLLTWKIWWAPNNAIKWQIEFNSAFKVLKFYTLLTQFIFHVCVRVCACVVLNAERLPESLTTKLHGVEYRKKSICTSLLPHNEKHLQLLAWHWAATSLTRVSHSSSKHCIAGDSSSARSLGETKYSWGQRTKRSFSLYFSSFNGNWRHFLTYSRMTDQLRTVNWRRWSW